MAELVAVGYPGETTAGEAQREAERLAHDLSIEPYAVASIARQQDGKLRTQITACSEPIGAAYGVFWGLLFDLLFYGPAPDAELQPLLERIEQAGVDADFGRQAQRLLGPRTSTLFLVVEHVTADSAFVALSRYGGTMVKTPFRTEVVLGAALPDDLTPTSA